MTIEPSFQEDSVSTELWTTRAGAGCVCQSEDGSLRLHFQLVRFVP